MRPRDAAALFGVVLYDDVEPIDVGATVGVVSMARRVLPNIAATTIAGRPGPVHCAGGLAVLAAHGFTDAPRCDVLIVTGGAGWRREAANPVMLDFLRGQPVGRVASVCTGALILGAAGLLAGRVATTRRMALGAEAESPLDLLTQMGAQARAAQLADADGLVTGGGVSLAIDATLHLIGRLYGDAARDEVTRAIEYDRAWAANRNALGAITPPG